jgi:hypothetical protein
MNHEINSINTNLEDQISIERFLVYSSRSTTDCRKNGDLAELNGVQMLCRCDDTHVVGLAEMNTIPRTHSHQLHSANCLALHTVRYFNFTSQEESRDAPIHMEFALLNPMA